MLTPACQLLISNVESEEDWSSDEEDSSDDVDFSTTPISSPWQFIFILLWQSIYKIFNGTISGLLRFLKAFIHFFGGAYAGLNILEVVPSNVLRYLRMNRDTCL